MTKTSFYLVTVGKEMFCIKCVFNNFLLSYVLKLEKNGWKDKSLDIIMSFLLSCSNLFCLINSFKPSGCSDSSGCVVQPHLAVYCTSEPLPPWPTCWASPPHPSLHAVKQQSRRRAVTTATPLQLQATKSPDISRSVAPFIQFAETGEIK